MKRWALLTVVAYLICMSVLTLPMLWLLLERQPALLEAWAIFFIPTLLLCQAVLLLVPVGVAQARPVKRRTIVVSAIVSAIPMALLALGFLTTFILLIWGEDATGDSLYEWPLLAVAALLWAIWGAVFVVTSRSHNPEGFIAHLTSCLLKGSILELLIAVPSHVVSRHREECCAPAFTLYAIAAGLSVALLSFGPGLFFLFTKRLRDKKARIAR